MIKAEHDLSTGCPQVFLQPGYMLTTKHLILFLENGADKRNAKMLSFHASKLPALADLPQALAGAERMWTLNQLHSQTTERWWKGRDNTFENEYSIHWWKAVSFSPFHPVFPSAGIHNTDSFRPGLLGRIKWKNEIPIKRQTYSGFFWRATARERGKRECHHPHSKRGVKLHLTVLCNAFPWMISLCGLMVVFRQRSWPTSQRAFWEP